jgi:hypothetical protein
MHDMRKTLAKPGGKPGEGDDILHAGIALYGAGAHAQCKAAGNPRKGGFDALTDPSAVEKESDLMTARRLFARQVDHVAEETTERGAENMRDSQFLTLQFTRRHRYTPTRTLPEGETNFRPFPRKRPSATLFAAVTSAEAGDLCRRRWDQHPQFVARKFSW